MSTDQTLRKRNVILGGGAHAVRIAAQLLHQGVVSLEELSIVDPYPRLLARFREQLKDCATKHLRSSRKEHMHAEDEDLTEFCRDRPGAFARGDRPCVASWLAHADDVISRMQLDQLHLRAVANWFSREAKGISVWTSAGELLTTRLILSLGQSRPFYPESVSGGRAKGVPIYSVFDRDFELDSVPTDGPPVVLGSGITSAQVVERYIDLGAEKVILITRRHFSKGEGKTSSLDWRGPELRRTLCGYASPQQRDEMLRAEGDKGTMPSWEIEHLESLIQAGRLEHRIGQVAHAFGVPGKKVEIHFQQGARPLLTPELTVCTGFVPELLSWVRAAALRAELPFYPDGTPRLTECLEWGEGSGLYMTGVQALRSAGPFAHNIVGGMILADGLCERFS